MPSVGQDAPDLPYTSDSTGEDGPLTFSQPLGYSPGRTRHSLVYDQARQRLVMHGGGGPNSTHLAETWTGDGAEWGLADTAGPKRGDGNLCAYDVIRGEIVLFGGYDPDRQAYVNETWVFDGTGWARRSPATQPRSESIPLLAYDEGRQRMILAAQSGEARLQTFSWDGTNWAAVATSTGPSRRVHSLLVYDAARTEMVLFGGILGNNRDAGLNDTWVWTGSDWVRRFPGMSPPRRYDHAMAYDAARQRVVLFGGVAGRGFHDDTWLWNGAEWTEARPVNRPPPLAGAAMAYDPGRRQVVLTGGADPLGMRSADTWAWDGTNWVQLSGPTTVVDMGTRPDGTWNYTTIHVPKGLEVRFKSNAANTPVRWLATGDVRIEGSINLAGLVGHWHADPTRAAAGGPGGFAGGLGGVSELRGGPIQGTAGQGPGGGLPAESTTSGHGSHVSSYGNPYLQPLVGGSGGGGYHAVADVDGGRGGGGGGAILIATSRDLFLSGQIQAHGGAGEPQLAVASVSGSGGDGSGGAIRLVADRIGLTGSAGAGREGRLRIEAYERNPAGPRSIPVPTQPFEGAGTGFRITSVAGQNVAQPPRNDPRNPDVIFSAPGEVVVSVQGERLPDGTHIRLRLVSPGTLIESPARPGPGVPLAAGRAELTLAVPKGSFSVQAFAETVSGSR